MSYKESIMIAIVRDKNANVNRMIKSSIEYDKSIKLLVGLRYDYKIPTITYDFGGTIGKIAAPSDVYFQTVYNKDEV